MQTPFDRAARVQRRALDAIRLSLLAELAREQAVAAEGARLDHQISHEASVAGADWRTSAHPYLTRQRARRRGLDDEGQRIDAALGQLRAAAMEACGQMQAIAGAAAGFAADHRRQEMVNDQARADDFAGTRISAGLQRAFVRR